MPERAGPPISQVLARPRRGDPLAAKVPALYIDARWVKYFSGESRAVEDRPERAVTVNLSAQEADIAVTALGIGTVEPGVWRLSYTLRVTRAATTSSALQLTIGWTEGGVAQTQASANLTGNLTTTREGGTFILRVDSATNITYTVEYTSVGATSMTFSLDIIAERLALDAA